MYLAGYIVAGFIVAGVYALRVAARARRDRYNRTALVVHAGVRLPGRAGPGARRRLGGARGREAPAGRSWRRSRACSRPRTGAPFTIGGFYDAGTARSASASRSRSCSRCWPSTTRTRTVTGLDSVPPRTARRSTSCASRSRRWSGSAPALALLGVVFFVDLVAQAAAARARLVLPRGDGRRPAGVRRADRRLDHDRGRPPAVDRLQRDAHDAGGDGAKGSRSATRARRSSTSALAGAVAWLLRRLARRPPETEVASR